jgi:hypothetical protein
MVEHLDIRHAIKHRTNGVGRCELTYSKRSEGFEYFNLKKDKHNRRTAKFKILLQQFDYDR